MTIAVLALEVAAFGALLIAGCGGGLLCRAADAAVGGGRRLVGRTVLSGLLLLAFGIATAAAATLAGGPTWGIVLLSVNGAVVGASLAEPLLQRPRGC